MTLSNFLFTSESVGEGHPDKVADQLSDAVLDEFLKHDPTARVACETLIKDNVVILAGEITSKHVVNYEKLVRAVVKDIGYDDSKLGFDDQGCSVMTFISQQSPDISMGVNEHEGLHKEQGAGDQGLMFGFACDVAVGDNRSDYCTGSRPCNCTNKAIPCYGVGLRTTPRGKDRHYGN